jgi:hypothetical protein
MGIILTEDQSRAIEQADEIPPKITDPRTRRTYVLVTVDVFDRIKALVGDTDYALADTYRAQLDSAMKAGWDDPAMDEYADYDAHKKP